VFVVREKCEMRSAVKTETISSLRGESSSAIRLYIFLSPPFGLFKSDINSCSWVGEVCLGLPTSYDLLSSSPELEFSERFRSIYKIFSS